jgi:hypothetical protein
MGEILEPCAELRKERATKIGVETAGVLAELRDLVAPMAKEMTELTQAIAEELVASFAVAD